MAPLIDGWLNRALRAPQRVVGYRATSRFFLRLSGSVPPIRCTLTKKREVARRRPIGLADDTLGERVTVLIGQNEF